VAEKWATDWSEKLDASLYESFIIRAYLMEHYNLEKRENQWHIAYC